MSHINTKCVQSGYEPQNGQSRVVPICQSTTYKYDSAETMGKLFDLEEDGFFYTRLANPTLDAVEKKIADLEGGVGAMLTSAGQAASLISVTNICHAGSHVVCASAVYGGTFNLFHKTLRELGIEFTFMAPDATEEEIMAAFRENTRAVFTESLANPALVVTDIEMYARCAHAHGVPLIVDNTFPTPINCRPFEHGADIVVHSTSKYMDGHAVALGGVVVDSGKFDWKNGKFPMLTTPDDTYHGVVYTEHFGPAAYIAKARVHLMRDFGAQASPQTRFYSIWGWKRSTCAWRATAKTRRSWRNFYSRAIKLNGSTTRGLKTINITSLHRSTCRRAAAASSPLAYGAAGKPPKS